MMDARTIGFVGLGRMGYGMARNLLQAGVPLCVYDARREPMDALAEQGATLAADPAELAGPADLLFVCLPSETESEAVLFGERGVAQGSAASLAVVDTTTMNRGAALHLAARAERGGVRYCDCPISGLPVRADNGTLTMMFGGDPTVFADAKPCLDIMGEFVVHCGAVGAGQLMKAVNNVIYDVNIAAVCEVLPLAVKAGLDPETVATVVTTASARSFASEHFLPRILDGRFDGDFSLQGAYKDIVNIEEVAAHFDASLPVVSAMVATYRAALDMGLGELSKSAMVKVYEHRLDQEVRRGNRPASGLET